MGLFTTSLRFFSPKFKNIVKNKRKGRNTFSCFWYFCRRKVHIKTEAISVGSATVGELMPIERSIQQHSISHFEMSHCHLASK